MSLLKSPLLFCLLFVFQFASGQNDTDIRSGNKFSIHSDFLDEDRSFFINVPDSYHEASAKGKKYPVLILLDGSAFFKTTVGIVHFMSSRRNRNYFMPETIIVAITNVDRERDFTVTKLKTKRANTMGGGRNFLNFIEKELIPYIDNTYRTVPVRTLVGHSLGGLLTLNSYMDKHSLFNKYLSIDPSIWWDDDKMKNKVEAIDSASFKKSLYIATANQGEAKYEKNKKRHDALYALIRKRTGDQHKVKIAYFEKEDHRSVLLIAIYEGLRYLNLGN